MVVLLRSYVEWLGVGCNDKDGGGEYFCSGGDRCSGGGRDGNGSYDGDPSMNIWVCGATIGSDPRHSTVPEMTVLSQVHF